MRILAIETSCDETAVAVVEAAGSGPSTSPGVNNYHVLGDALFSQAHLHAEYGGVYPTLAKREHIKNLPLLLEQALKEAGSDGSDVDLIAVTRGPGLEPALWAGIEFAEALGREWGKPVTGIDHMEGHIVSALLKQESKVPSPQSSVSKDYGLQTVDLPLLALLISGGHTEFILMKNWFDYHLVGRTKDDAVGEAFDKVARMLGLPYPGGPHVARTAKERRGTSKETEITFPRPMAGDNTCDFSFSGLKTAVLYKVKDMKELSPEDVAHVAQAFEDAVRDVIVLKTRRALERTLPATFVVGGGVSANAEIREGLETLVRDEFPDTVLAFPDKSLTGDNAIMIAAAAHLRFAAGHTSAPLTAHGAQSLA